VSIKPNTRIRLNSEESKDSLVPPNMVAIQKNSFKRFLEFGVLEELKQISPVISYNGKLSLEFLEGYKFDKPEYSFQDCQHHEITYSTALRVPVRLINKETGEILEQEVFMSEMPLMSDAGTFLINGAERVVVSQFVRSPGVYFRKKTSITPNRMQYIATIIPNRGAWLEIETDKDNILFVNINKLKNYQ